jgi:hypothetical protein
MLILDDTTNEIQYEYVCIDNVIHIEQHPSLGIKYGPVTLPKMCFLEEPVTLPKMCFSEESDFQR